MSVRARCMAVPTVYCILHHELSNILHALRFGLMIRGRLGTCRSNRQPLHRDKEGARMDPPSTLRFSPPPPPSLPTWNMSHSHNPTQSTPAA